MIRHLVHSLPISHVILRVAALFVPHREREEWLAEWRAELWHVWRSCNHQAEVTAFCFGAFQDALWLRGNNKHSVPRRLFRPGSPWRCGLSLAIWAVAGMLICFCLPGARRAMHPLPYRDAGDLVMISRAGYSSEHAPTIRLEEYQAWKTSTRDLFTGLAFYQPMRKRIHVGRYQTADMSVARATSNLFEVLHLPIPVTARDQMNRPYMASLVLSQKVWKKYFHGDAGNAGHIVDIAGQKVRIAGVMAEDSWQLPGQIDAWVFEDEQHMDALPSSTRGYVLAHVKASGLSPHAVARRSMTVFRDTGEADRYDCVSLEQQAQLPFFFFVFTLFLACLALPATTPLPLGEYPVHGDRLPSIMRFRRWFFLAAKVSLIVPIVYFSSLDLAYASLPIDSPAAQGIQFVSSFFGFLFAFRWALQDQRRRCPECLRLLTNPARVGQASRNFLAWNGTELICAVGHGLLHIPEIPTSWFGTQRWFYLDSSWSSLFSDTYLASAGTS